MTLFPKRKKHLQKFRVWPAALKKMFRVTAGSYAPNCHSQNQCRRARLSMSTVMSSSPSSVKSNSKKGGREGMVAASEVDRTGCVPKCWTSPNEWDPLPQPPPRHAACGVLVPRPGFEPVPPASEVWCSSHWIGRGVPWNKFLLGVLRGNMIYFILKV